MASLESSKAIGEVTKLIIEKLTETINSKENGDSPEVLLGFPRDTPKSKMYLLLYEIEFDPSLKNVLLDQEQPAPIWLVLKYLLTAYGSEVASEKYKPFENIGKAIQTLQRLNFLNPSTLTSYQALKHNPEPLKITFDRVPLELISRIFGVANEKHQCSVCFQIRPVMITLDSMPSHSLRVGADYMKGKNIGNNGALLSVENLGIPVIEEIKCIEGKNGEEEEVDDPRIEFDIDSKKVLIIGSKLDTPHLYVRLDSRDFPVSSPPRSFARLEWTVDVGEVSAGSYLLCLVEKKIENDTEIVKSVSNVKIIHFVPYLNDAEVRKDKIILSGKLLGREGDAVTVAFYKEGEGREKGRIVEFYNDFKEHDYSSDQRKLTIRHPKILDIYGTYRLILRVNNQQARKNPEIVILGRGDN